MDPASQRVKYNVDKSCCIRVDSNTLIKVTVHTPKPRVKRAQTEPKTKKAKKKSVKKKLCK